jgi:group I intron endonuclease
MGRKKKRNGREGRVGIYRIVDKDGREYVGSTNNLMKRGRQHFRDLQRGVHRNRILQRTYDKHVIGEGQKDYFHYEELLLCEECELELYEQNILDNVELHYNIALDVLSPMRGRPLTEEHKRKISQANSGKSYRAGFKHLDETKKKIGLAHRGKKLKKSTREKIGNAHRGRSLTKEHKEKIGAAHRGKKSHRAQPIQQICTETEIVVRNYDTIEEVRKYGFEPSNVGAVCRGLRKTSGGYGWRFLEKRKELTNVT